MRVATAGQPEHFGYFVWAFENLPAVAGIAESLGEDSGEEVGPRVALAVRRSFVKETAGHPLGLGPVNGRREEHYWDRGAGEPAGPLTEVRYADVVGATPARLLDEGEEHFAADARRVAPRAEAAAYRLMLNSFLMSFLRADSCLPWLGVLLLRGPLERQFTIARFLHLVTEADVPGAYDRPPSRDLVLAWARAVGDGTVSFRPGIALESAVDTYLQALRRGGGSAE